MTPFEKPLHATGEWWRRLSRLAKIIVVALIAGFGFWFFHGSGNSNKDRKPQAPIVVATVSRKDVPVYFNGLGTIQAYNTVTVHSQIDGQLISVLFDEGQDVHAGDVLAKIDPRTYQAQFDQAEANKAKDEATLQNAKLDLTRYINLGDSVSGQTLDTQRSLVQQLEATVKADKAAVDSARTQLSYTVITSLINGRTGIRQVDAGNVIHAADANGLVVITQLQPISVVFSLPQQNLQAINEQLNGQQKLSVIAVDADGHSVLDTGELQLVDNEIDQATGTIRLKATFPNEKRQLWPGGFVNVRLLVTTRENAIVVPTVAVQRGPQNSYVFIFKPDGSTVEIRPVKVAMTEDQDSVIDDGVTEGEQVVIDGMGKLQDGSKVTLADKGDQKKSDAVPNQPDAAAQSPDQEKPKHRHKQDN